VGRVSGVVPTTNLYGMPTVEEVNVAVSASYVKEVLDVYESTRFESTARIPLNRAQIENMKSEWLYRSPFYEAMLPELDTVVFMEGKHQPLSIFGKAVQKSVYDSFESEKYHDIFR
jgi:hypothetical protein